MRLSELKDGDKAIITSINSVGEYSKRLTEMGFIKGRGITVIKNAPLKDPIEYELMGYSVSLRRKEAALIDVVLESNTESINNLKLGSDSFSINKSNDIGNTPPRNSKEIKVALVGNPNCGKTTLFNYISGRDEHVGNFSGITVDLKDATIKHKGYKINITDLPGTYSLSTYSPEEKIVKEELSTKKYDFIINIVDTTLLERNLYLTTQLMDMACPIIVSLNLYDEFKRSGDKFNHTQLGEMLEIPFIPTSARYGKGVENILDTIVKKYEQGISDTHIETNLGSFIEDRLAAIIAKIEKLELNNNLPHRYIALDLISGDESLMAKLDEKTAKMCMVFRRQIEHEYGDNITQVLADARYGYIAGALAETLTVDGSRNKKSINIDSVLTHKVWGYPIFLGIIWFMFYSTFTLGAYPQEWIESGVVALGEWLNGIMQEGALKDLVIEGIIGGVGSVIVFLPNILILFLFISLMEDSGYMARAAFIMDKLMHKIGLHGKSFVPMIMGFGCNVPAIMASRIIEDKSNRLLTILIIPFMSCSARLPVYIFIIGTFFPQYPSLMLFGLYLFGVILAILTAITFKKLLFKGQDHPFVMELPPYRIPLINNTAKHMWNKSKQYLHKMGGVILIGAIIIWALGYYPSRQNSYLEKIGHTIEPAIAPIGFDWKIGVSLISGVAAKEIIISTMGVLYNVENTEDVVDKHSHNLEANSTSNNTASEIKSLQQKVRTDRYKNGKHKGELIFTTPVTLSYLSFILIYFPCLAVIAAIKRESNSWRWAIFTLLYTTSLAWCISFIIYNIGSLIV